MGKPKPGVKDPTVPATVRTFRFIFNRPVAGAVTAALVVRLASTLHGLKVQQMVTKTTGVSGSVGRYVTLIGSALIGIGIGFGSTTILQTFRRMLIERLLTYNGWIFEQTSTRTKLWGLTLKLLIGPGPHTLYEFEDILPKLPLPTLEQTCEKYLNTVEPLLTSEEFQNTKNLVEAFKKNEGPTLQKYLQDKQRRTRSWLADWWLDVAYLSRREPIAVNVNFFMMGTIKPEVSTNCIARAANSLYVITRYYEMIQDESLPPDMIMDMIPVCMESVRYMLGSCRIPGKEVDSLTIHRNSRHAVVISKGKYFRFDMYAPDPRTGKSRILSKAEIKKQLETIKRQTDGVTDVNMVASLTSDDRTEWYNNRQKLLQDSINAATMKEIETAIFILVLGDDPPKDFSEHARLALIGNGSNRWFDKGLTIEIFDRTAAGLGNMEHSGADATHFNIMWEHCLQHEEFGPDGDLIAHPGETIRSLSPPKQLHWNFTPEMKSIIDRTFSQYKSTMAADVDVVVFATSYGKKWMKQQKISPDGYLQMAVQLAYWRLYKEFTKTYEPASHRLFALGRTDNINPVSKHSIRWVESMHDPSIGSETKIQLMRQAIDYQSKVRLEATAGFGSDRHLLGLACAAKDLGLKTPKIFENKAYKLPMKLSTSQVPTNLGYYGLPLILESTLGGFGPVCHDGYGLLYCNMGDNMFNFNVTSWKSCTQTDSTVLAEAIKRALSDMKSLMEGKHLENQHQVSYKL